VGHEVGLHTQAPVVVSHACPDAHVAHIAPPMPHALIPCIPGATHAPLGVQHPLGHVLALHTQWPELVSHSVPDGHWAHNVPIAPHDMVDSLARGSHMAVDVQQPAHADPPQVHAPPEQLPPAAHGAHIVPPLPHDAGDCALNGSHWPLVVQHPLAHVEGPHGGGAASTALSGCASWPCVTSTVASPASSPEGASLPELVPLELPLEDELDPPPSSPPGAGL
jgi:hypothetical protein